MKKKEVEIKQTTRAYAEGLLAFHDCVPWVKNPYDAGTVSWCEWNNGKHDAGEDATAEEMDAYFSKIAERSA